MRGKNTRDIVNIALSSSLYASGVQKSKSRGFVRCSVREDDQYVKIENITIFTLLVFWRKVSKLITCSRVWDRFAIHSWVTFTTKSSLNKVGSPKNRGKLQILCFRCPHYFSTRFPNTSDIVLQFLFGHLSCFPHLCSSLLAHERHVICRSDSCIQGSKWAHAPTL